MFELKPAVFGPVSEPLSSDVSPIAQPGTSLSNPLTSASTRSSSPATVKAIAFIDTNVTDYQALAAGIVLGTEVHILNSSQDAVTQITNTLLGRHDISSLHVVSHGEVGGLDFGTSRLNLSDLPEYAAQLQSWSKALTDDADLLLYGCDVAQGELGKAFTSILSQLTGADVAASADLTGSAALGGNWTLEHQTGSVEAGLAFSQSVRESYTYILPTVTVSGTPLAYTENAPATLLDSTATVADDSANFNTGTLTVSYTAGSTADDRLTILNQGTGIGQISLDGRVVKFGGTTIGTYTGGTGTTPLVITFNSASATPAAAQALLRAIAFSNVSQTPSTTARSVQITVFDGIDTSTPVTRTINVAAINDAPLVGNTTVLYNGAAGTLPSAQGWTYIGPGVTPTVSGGATNLNTTGNANFLAGFGTSAVTLDRTAGYVVSFSAQVVSEARTATADKDLDGKDDRAGFSIIVVSSDTTKAIELGFLSGRVFAQEDGTKQVDPSLQPDATAPNATRTLFTQAESAAFTTTAFTNYDLAIKDDTYTLLVNNTVLLSGRLRDYTGFSGFPDPYQVPNQIFFGDDTTSAAANINLSRIAVTTNPVTLPSQTVNEDSPIVLSNLFLGDLDAGANAVTLTLAVANGTITVNNFSGSALSNNGTATVTVTGTLNQINAILTNATGITYQGNSHYNGSDTLTLSLNDNGASGGSPITITKMLPIVITAVNDAPVSTTDTLTAVAEDFGVRSIAFASLLSNDSAGPANESGQTLTITNVSNVVGGTAVIAGSNIEFTPTLNYNGPASFDYTVQDNGTTNGANDFKTATGNASFSITAANDAPTLTGNATLPAVNQNATNATGSTLTNLFGSLFSDPDTGASLSGLAIVGNTANATTQGRWQYSLTGTTWSDIGTVAEGATALALSASTRVRFVPVANYAGAPPSLSVRALDNTYSGGFTTTTPVLVNTTTNGGSTAIAATATTLSTSVTARVPNLLWRNSVSGENVDWQLNNYSVQSSYFLPAITEAGWQIAASNADFNQDGFVDILWRNQNTGLNVIWEMNSTGFQAGYFIEPIADTNWQIAGTADFNRDGITDIVWRNQASGENVVWQQNGATLTTRYFLPAITEAGWQIVSTTGDFNRDGIGDLLWRNQTTGANVVWQMNTAGLRETGYFIQSLADANWQIAGTGDLDRDGVADIVWRNRTSGENAIWKVTGTSVQSVFFTQVADTNWQIAGVADLGGNSTPELLWQNKVAGQEVIWQMNGFSLCSRL